MKPKNGLKGELTIPADKSISHRAVMFSSLAKGSCIIRNFSSGADCRSTLNLFKKLGVDINVTEEKTLTVKSDGMLKSSDIPLYCGNSGTTMRLVSGILAGSNNEYILTGDESLSKRPMKRIIEPLKLMGAKIYSDNGCAPLKIIGTELHGIEYSSPLASAQVKSCILLAGMNADGKTVYKEPYLSRNHTELMLKYMGADIKAKDNVISISKSDLTAKDIDIAGDISSAAFFIAAGLIVPNSDIIIKNTGINPTRTGILDVVKRMGGSLELMNKVEKSGEVVADIHVNYTDNLKACTIEGADIPRLIDELPVIAILASQAEGETVVKDAQDLRNKESDRIKCLVCELSKIGIDIEEREDGFIVKGKTKIRGGAELNSYNDHRLGMSFYVAGLLADNELGIEGYEWTKISFPEFDEMMNNLQ